MTFDEYWVEVEKLKALPSTAIKQLPASLSAETKKRLMKRRPDEAVELLIASISEIDHGSVESVDSLVKRRL